MQNTPNARQFLRSVAMVAGLITGALVFPSCGSDSHPVVGKPTGAVCPATQTLTYAGFGRPFIDKYCQRCHAEAVTGAARNGAPDDHTFDTQADIITLRDHMDEKAGSGPDATNTSMPPTAPIPTTAERMQFSEWVACGAP